MIAILEWTLSNVQQNLEQLQTPTMGATINKKSTTTEPPPYKGQQPKPPGDLNAFYWYQIFALDSAVVEVQEMFSSHGGHFGFGDYFSVKWNKIHISSALIYRFVKLIYYENYEPYYIDVTRV